MNPIFAILQFGPFFLAILFLWGDYKRDRLSNRLDQLKLREVILLVKDCSAVIAKNTAVMERIERHLDRWLENNAETGI